MASSSITVAAAAADPKTFASRLRLLLDADDGTGASGDPAAVEDLLRVGEGALEVAAAKKVDGGADCWLSRAAGVLDATAFVAENCLADGAAGAALSLGALASSESGAASAALWRLGLPDAAVTVLERAAKAAARAAKLAEASGDDDGGDGDKAKRRTKKDEKETEEDREAKRELRRRSSSGIYATAASFALDDDDDDDDDEGGGGRGGGGSSSSPSAATALAAAAALRALVARDPRRASAARATGVAGSLAALVLHSPSNSLIVASAALLADLADALAEKNEEKEAEEGSPKKKKRKRKGDGGGLPLPAATAAALLRPAASLLEDEACEGGDQEAEEALWGLLASAAERVVSAEEGEGEGEREGEGGDEEEGAGRGEGEGEGEEGKNDESAPAAVARRFADERGVDLARLADARARALRSKKKPGGTAAAAAVAPSPRLPGLPRRAALALAAAASAGGLARRALEGTARGS